MLNQNKSKMQMKKTLVIGASENPSRYSYKAINSLLKHQHEVVAIGVKEGVVNGVKIETQHLPFKDIDTITLYVNPAIQKEFYDYIFSLNPKRIIFNPGTENNEFEKLARIKGIETEEACTLVMLSANQY
jgi:predicted CoA-binding protein